MNETVPQKSRFRCHENIDPDPEQTKETKEIEQSDRPVSLRQRLKMK
jgi:hypothetical protein